MSDSHKVVLALGNMCVCGCVCIYLIYNKSYITGSGVETPTSEPGVSLTDMWDSDWDDEPEDRFIYRHQVRESI